MEESITKPLLPKEGLYVLHLFYELHRSVWENLSDEAQAAGKVRLATLVEEVRGWARFQIVTLSMIARADLGFMIVGPDLQQVNALEKRLTKSLGTEVLRPVYTFFSLTESSEYTTSEVDYEKELIEKDGLASDSPELAQKMAGFRERIKHYTHDRMYPTLPVWEFFCFYPMLKRRAVGQNWYALDFEQRRQLMKGHATVGRKYSGRISQLITGSTGLDDWEWGVTLFAHDPFEVKAIVYEMRFDEVSAAYGEFGEFFTGLPLPVMEILHRLEI